MFALFQQEFGRYLFQHDDNGGVEISDDYHNELINLQASGSVIEPDENNHPVAVPQSPTNGLGVYTPLEFLEKFTQVEQLNVVSATMSNSEVKLWYDKMLAASFVDLTDQRTIEGLNSLVTAGLLSAERPHEILGGFNP
ncbi:hypothetical protein [Methylophilus sp. QUAN]|uniref:hypothetical protein n=1 Tax=Methylophilus sp. QUAN TaxID=2781020 RepID=UPI00188E4C62|nr:hypothetical protein [Methylophilus sp. QUAN]MBF4990684.1 hypothetical protein [Methylophilus sp. QUAN]